ncbi:CHASE3 domain sensor protein [Bacillus sp. SLBN-46]|uniref:hypothetical protein n=1 Tax=Bacillus sp. SLBN-46 TaxID=3042283 RepID=UPI00285CFBAA|nr:hypothetical protein [Bacillus sp. SLBN-46]MDR6124509.1 CHASE3 domain sensor protein [Bacillus sp. SLBN-46]
MAAKKDNLKESLKETITRKKKQEVDETVEIVDEPLLEEKQDEETIVDGENEASLSSLDLLWRYAFAELDEWAKCVDHRDEALLKEVRRFSEIVQRNQGSKKAIAEQFIKEFTEWEKTARDEFLMSTTTLQHFFPVQSYEEINAQMDQIQKTVLSLLSTPCRTIANYQSIEKNIEMMEHYIDLRKKGRVQYIKTIKQAGNPLYEYQKGFVNLFATKFKELIFPLNKYMENTEEPTKS